MANETKTPGPATADANKPRVLADLTQKPAVGPDPNSKDSDKPKDKGPLQSFNGQKARTSDEERAAYRRRLRRWHKKAMMGLSLETVRGLITEALGYTKEDTADEA